MSAIHPELLEPVRRLPGEDKSEPTTGTALCLSGGGYRAMLFHVGVLWRLNEAGWLPRLDRVSSVSGGSITAAALALAWPHLNFDAQGHASAFADRVADPLLSLAEETIDERSVITGGISPFKSIADHVAAEYRKHLLGSAKLADLPAKPTFVFNATNLETGDLFRFTKDVLVSDAGGQMSMDPDPPSDWGRQTLRVLKVIDNQVRTLRKLQVIGSLERGTREGLYLGIRSDPASYQIPDVIAVAPKVRTALAKISTRLAPPGGDNAQRLINWGYALCDTGLRAHLDTSAAKGSLPYPAAPLA